MREGWTYGAVSIVHFPGEVWEVHDHRRGFLRVLVFDEHEVPHVTCTGDAFQIAFNGPMPRQFAATRTGSPNTDDGGSGGG